MAVTIDKGEKHLFKRRLLESDDTVIPWADVDNITFELSVLGRKTVKTWSKLSGDVNPSGEFAQFEFDSTDFIANTYYIKATLVTTDTKWANNTTDEISWDSEVITIIDSVNAYNPSSSEADIKFDVA